MAQPPLLREGGDCGFPRTIETRATTSPQFRLLHLFKHRVRTGRNRVEIMQDVGFEVAQRYL